jgi:hypothetical protein
MVSKLYPAGLQIVHKMSNKVISANAILVSSYALVRRCVHRTGRPTLGLYSSALVRAKIALFRLESASCSAFVL